jgi:hypothetical protein
MFAHRMALALMGACSFLVGCEVTGPIQPAESTKSAFDAAVYKGTTVTVKPAPAGAETYRVFIKGATGFVSMSSVRSDAEQRATEFCDRRGKEMESLTETTSNPPYILGNFPRIEIVFHCIAKSAPLVLPAVTDPKYTKLIDLKKLLDSGVVTQAEFDSEKAKILSQP